MFPRLSHFLSRFFSARPSFAACAVEFPEVSLMYKNLFDASYNTAIRDVKMLISNGEDVNVRDRDGNTPLMYAALNGSTTEGLRLLIEAGADPNAKNDTGWSVLHFAALNPLSKMADFLCEHSANVNARDIEGHTPLTTAAIKNTSPDVLSFLVHAGCSLEARDNEGRTALHWAARKNNLAEIVKVLIDLGADIEALDDNNFTPLLHSAGHNRSPEVTKTLIDAGANVNHKANNLVTARMLAAAGNTQEILDLLASAGAVKFKDEIELKKQKLGITSTPDTTDGMPPLSAFSSPDNA